MYIIKKNKNDKWIIIKEGSKRATRVFDTKFEAISYANDKYPDKYKVEEDIITEAIKKHGKKPWFICLVIFIILLIIGVCVLYFKGYLDPYLPSNNNNNNHQHVEGIVYDDFQVHFLELGNEYTGDSTYIKAGDIDILIDAGSRKNSAVVIKEYVDKYCTDNKLEYVIATHGDQDHIAGFVGSGSLPNKTGILYQYEVETIIMNELTNKETQIYSDFLTAVDYCKGNGTNVYYAADCFNNVNNAKRSYQLTEDITLDILYNKYYFEETSDENDYSVCTLFTYENAEDDHRFLFTGDLEHDGEEALADYYSKNSGLGHCRLFKGGHHGSKTSSNECLLSLITPEIVCVCCCAGSTEYTANYNNIFPTQDMITRVAKYTENLYVTTLFNEKTLEFESFNGDMIVSCDGINVGFAASKTTCKLKDSEWFNEIVYVDENNNIVSRKGEDDFFTEDTPGVKAVKRRIWPS